MEAAGQGGADGEWAVVCDGPCPSQRIADEWLSGLSYNPAAPATVLIRMLDARYAACLLRKDLPPGVLDAAVIHPSRRSGTSCWTRGRACPRSSMSS